MIGYFPDVSLIWMLQQITLSTLKLKLFTNNVTPSDNSVISDFTLATWTGYVDVSLVSGTWVSLGVASHVGTIVYPACVFSNSSGSNQSAYGWIITNSAGTQLISCGLLDAAPVTIANGSTYSFIPTLGDLSQN